MKRQVNKQQRSKRNHKSCFFEKFIEIDKMLPKIWVETNLNIRTKWEDITSDNKDIRGREG
jgi:hypothetical protein